VTAFAPRSGISQTTSPGCKYCPNVSFDKECLDQLRAGTLPRHICDRDHEWLHIPKWSDVEYEYFEVGKGRVRVGGEMRDGKRVGGHAVDVGTWLRYLAQRLGNREAGWTRRRKTSDMSKRSDDDALLRPLLRWGAKKGKYGTQCRLNAEAGEALGRQALVTAYARRCALF
jgi:hypothetical protein